MQSEDVRGILVYGAAAPILVTWSLVSFLPLAGAGMAWGSPLLVLAHLGFLAIGFAGFLFAWPFYRWSRSKAFEATDFVVTQADRRKRVTWLALYALIWMTAYSLFATLTG